MFFHVPRMCVNKADNFCYICSEVIFVSQKSSITDMVRKAYHLYCGCNISDQDKKWAPHICCNTCATNLCQWLNKKRKCIPFTVPMTWREPIDHSSNCYICMMPPVGNGLSKRKSSLCNIQTFHQIFAQYPTEKDYMFLMHQNRFHLSQMRKMTRMR